VLLVTLPEETPVNELVDTAYTLEDRVGVQLGPVVVNAVPAELVLTGRSTAEDAVAAGVQIPASEIRALDEAAAFRLERHQLALDQAARLADRLPLPQLHLPFLFGEIGPSEINQLADALAGAVAALPEPGS
jgi:hypothetical protein